MDKTTIHTVCSKRQNGHLCVELFLDHEMKIQDVSKPYQAGERTDIRLDGRVIQEANPEPESQGCASCEEARKAKKANLLTRLAKGVPGLLKSELGIDQAGPSLARARRGICLECPSGYYDFGVCSEERGGCGCFLASKVTIGGEACPEGHW